MFCGDTFILAFFFIAPFAPFAPAFLGFIKDYTADVYGNWEPLRTYLPTVFYPLFFALPLLVALLGDKLKSLGGRAPNKAMRLLLGDYRAAVAVCCALIVAAAAPLMVAAPKAFAPYTTPFYQCIKDAAQREKLKSGLASVRFRPAGVFGGMEKLGSIGDIGYAYPDNRVFYPELSFTNPEYLRGSFDFVLVNSTAEGRLMYPPQRDLCYPNSLETPKRTAHYQCNPHPAQFGFYITGETTEARFGKPDKIVKCPGTALWIYRPPQKFQ